MRKHKSVISILLAVMMIFTFMPAMAFAAPVVVGNHTYSYTDVNWTDDFHTAQITVKDVEQSAGVVVKTTNKTVTFDFYDQVNGVEASRTDAENNKIRFFVAKGTDFGLSAFGSAPFTYGLYAVRAVENTRSYGYTRTWDYDYVWDIENAKLVTLGGFVYLPEENTYSGSWTRDVDVTDWVCYGSDRDALKEQLSKSVYDATYMIAGYSSTVSFKDSAQLHVITDAGQYSAWKQGKKNAVQPVKINSFGGLINDTNYEYFTVTYPDYNAYAVEGNENKVLDMTVALNAAAITSQYGPKNVSTATRTIKLEANVDNNQEPFFAQWHLEGDDTENEYNVDYEDQVLAPGEAPEYGINDGLVIYKGSSYKVVLDHPAENTTVKYFVTTDSTKTAAQIKDADWTETQPEIKNVGTYYVFLQLTTTKGNTTFKTVFSPAECHTDYEWAVGNGGVTVQKYVVPLTFTQDYLTVEYGKYTLADLEEVIAKLVTVGSTPDSADKVAAAFNKYKVFKGLFEEAGESKVGVTVDTAKVAKDADLAAALANYAFDGNTLWLTVQKVDNNVEINAPSTKTFKASKKTKKLAKNKSFTISATARMGEVTFSKVSGNDKIKVSKAGKITVKKGLKKGKTYKVKVKALVQGTANYKQASATKTIKIKIK